MLFRAGDDLLARIRAAVLRGPRAPRQPPAVDRRNERPPVSASITYYGSLGEMGHEDDRANDFDWGDPRGERS